MVEIQRSVFVRMYVIPQQSYLSQINTTHTNVDRKRKSRDCSTCAIIRNSDLNKCNILMY